MKSKRQAVRETQKKQKKITSIIAITVIALLAIAIVYFIWSSATASGISPIVGGGMLGEAFPVSGANDHIADGSDPGPYSTNPPTSGRHYPNWLDAGFYDTNNFPYPQGKLVHNLEHGYIIFWYNCKILDETQCNELKTQIKAVIDATGKFKVIGYPWESIDVPVVATSWGYRMSFTTFDTQTARTFVDQHRNRAPEPDAP